MIKAILFDLDGTLLPMDQDEFIRAYFGALAKKLAPYGYEQDKLIETVGKGTWAMIANDGSDTNEHVFWKYFTGVYGEKSIAAIDILEEFYTTDFNAVAKVCGCNPRSAQLIAKLKSEGYRLALATNPIFPEIATRARVRWAGLKFEDFEYVSTYENISYCKPNIKYYESILNVLDLAADECLMVGNDAEEDMIAEKLGMRTFLLTDCLLNRKKLDISRWPGGGFDELEAYIEKINVDQA